MRDFLSKIEEFANSVHQVSSWRSSKAPFGHLFSENPPMVKDNYVYEFFCYTEILKDLSSVEGCSIEFVEGNNCFPRAPASRVNRPYFGVFRSDVEVFRVYSGIRIQTNVTSLKKAPDISFLRPDENDDQELNYQDVILIMDTKFGANIITCQEGQYTDFAYMIRKLGCETVDMNGLVFNRFEAIQKNCVITNGEPFTDDPLRLQSDGIQILKQFTIDCTLIQVVG